VPKSLPPKWFYDERGSELFDKITRLDEFLAALRARMGPADSLLLGTDLVKDPAVLVAAYDDAAGVTAEFNKNILHVLNTELGADSTRTTSITWPSGTPAPSGSRCGCARPGGSTSPCPPSA
jgi:uncharacterized SAM-dependent methyltransferase